MRPSRRHDASVYLRRRLVAAGALSVGAILTVTVTAADDAGNAGAGRASTSTTVAPASTASTTMPMSTVPVTTTPPGTLSEPLRLGSSGEAVRELQDRLRELGFEPGPSDGQFGTLTQQAVWAYEKLVVGSPSGAATGIVTGELWQRLREQGPIEPRRTHAGGDTTVDHTEVYLAEQVVAFFIDDEPVLISHMSSGSGERWRETVTIGPGEYRNENGTESIQLGLIGESVTPGGVYQYDRVVSGRRLGALGAMYDPAYFNYGIAIHGGDAVPLVPASHGCIRIPRYISERFHQLIDRGDQVWVWDGENEPEWLGQVPPPFDQLDPNWNG